MPSPYEFEERSRSAFARARSGVTHEGRRHVPPQMAADTSAAASRIDTGRLLLIEPGIPQDRLRTAANLVDLDELIGRPAGGRTCRTSPPERWVVYPGSLLPRKRTERRFRGAGGR